ncbi:hypothetical protein BGM00_08970 [Vibrio parahaemolyticus]|nr:hypothetical protein BGM00_08970 [Vibrio parahaemolyticus]
MFRVKQLLGGRLSLRNYNAQVGETYAMIKSETAMFRVKQLLGGRLSLRNYNAQVGETYAMIKALNKLTGLDMPETQCIV